MVDSILKIPEPDVKIPDFRVRLLSDTSIRNMWESLGLSGIVREDT